MENMTMPKTPLETDQPANTSIQESASPRRRRDRDVRESEILEAAFSEFAARGYAATRMEDVAHRAGVAKGLPSFYFASKDALFKAVLRRLILPDWDALETRFAKSDRATAELLREFIGLIYERLVDNPRAHQVLRLLIAEGPRLPELTEFYHAEVIERAIALLGSLLARGIERDDIRPGSYARYPQVIMAPALMAVLWNLLFATDHPLDRAGFLEAHLDLVLNGLAAR
jgi:AcrR family transcriptional regulator